MKKKHLKDKDISDIKNGKIWIQKTEFLNYKREGNLIKELFSNKTWVVNDWAKKIDLNINLNRYVTSFSKSVPTEKMVKEYGGNIFSYKTDRIANNIAPLGQYSKKLKMFTMIKCFDVIYGKENAKEELNYLFSIIDLFDIHDREKIDFANHIIMYWDLSFKDKKWSGEKERKYLIFLYEDNFDYIDIEKDSRFLKIKTTLFLYPDFVSKENIIKNHLSINRFEKVSAIKHRKTLFCKDCLNDEIVVWQDKGETCSICKSANVIILNEKKL